MINRRLEIAATIAAGIASKMSESTDTSKMGGRRNIAKRALALADELIELANTTEPGKVDP